MVAHCLKCKDGSNGTVCDKCATGFNQKGGVCVVKGEVRSI